MVSAESMIDKKLLIRANPIYSSPTPKIKLAQDYLNAGNLPIAISLLKEIIASLNDAPNSQLEYTAQLTLGNAYLLQRDYSKAIDNYLSSWKIVSSLPVQPASLAVLNNLSLAYYRQGQDLLLSAQKAADYDQHRQQKEKEVSVTMLQAALDYGAKALELADTSPHSLSKVRAWLNWQKISGSSSPSNYEQQIAILESLPPSSSKASLLIEIADYAQTITEKRNTLNKAVTTAESIDDYRNLSWAWGNLGALAEERGLLSVAIEETEKAIIAAKTVLATDIMYRWQWQLGRIYTTNEETELAQFFYTEAISLIELTKKDLLIGIRNKQVNFTTEVEPIYRQYFKLLIEELADYQKAWFVAELLAKAELESYFGDNCFEEKQSQQIPDNTAIIRSINLDSNTYLMVKLPSEEIKVFSINIATEDLNQLINQWRYQLELPVDNSYRIIGRQLYNLFIQPITQDLTQIKHLVFINDGLLRTIPMAALFDSQEHLIEKYSISYSFGSDLAVNHQHSHQLLAFGISNFTNNLPQLPQVKQEFSAIKEVIGGKFLLNNDFTLNNLRKELDKKYSLLHLATHTYFGGSLENIFFQAYESQISLLELEQILIDEQFQIELLVLSSCETAIGDEDALLGLAGIGIRTGITNTIGTVWAVNSNSSLDLLSSFYKYYAQNNITSADALKQAQLQLIARQLHPYHWSGFINIY